MHPHLRAIVTTKNRSILNECHLQTQTGSGDCGTDAGHAPTGHYKIERMANRFFPGCIARTQPFHQGCIRRGHPVRIGSEQNGIASTVKTGLIAESQRIRACLQHHTPRLLPLPTVAGIPNTGGKFGPINHNRKSTGPLPFIPGSHPVKRPNIHSISTITRYRNHARSIRNRPAQPMRHQIRRTH